MTNALISGDSLGHSRFVDLYEEPKRQLAPIKGHEKMPLVSLEKAIEPISHLFDDINQYVWTAKNNCQNPEEGLTQDESASIYLYTMEFKPGPSLYQILNKMLRSEKRGDLKQWFLYLKLFLTAMHKLPSHQCKVWRGLCNINLTLQYKNGEEFVWWGISTCTLSVDVLKNDQFFVKHRIRTICSIECKNGKQISSHSYSKKEEIILLPGSCFHVKGSLKMESSCHMISIEEIEPSITSIPVLYIPGITNHFTIKLLTLFIIARKSESIRQ
jgi:hypothetical protein